MKKVFWAFFALFISYSLIMAHTAVAAEENKADAEKKAALRKKIEAKKLDLNGTQWEVNLSSADPKAKLKKDTFTFQNNQFISANNSSKGYKATNYTISIPSMDQEVAVWETMQTSPKGEVTFIRGEWLKDAMAGVITEQMEEGKTAEYSFTTASKVAISPSSESELSEEEAPSEDEKYETLISKETPKDGISEKKTSGSKNVFVS